MPAAASPLVLLLLLAACSAGEPATRPLDLAPPRPEGCAGDGTKPVGEACANATRCDCSGPAPACLAALDLPEALALPGGYCTNPGCDVRDSASTCGEGGVCVALGGGRAALCLQRCRGGQCRAGYACLYITVDAADPMSRVASVCAPTEGLVECDPTRDPATQCTTVGGVPVSTMTNGAPSAACWRVGPDDVGQCRYLPCQIGPGNCPPVGGRAAGCFYLDLERDHPNRNPADRWKGAACLPLSGPDRREGDECPGAMNTCGDNLVCHERRCRQLCHRGRPPTYAGGDARYKQPAAPCPAERTCQNVHGLTGDSWPGVCLP